ncbi:MAG: hypothetical protein ACT4PW_14725 [Acidimicrobiia bacterium]
MATNDWMSHLSNSDTIDQLNIPGTHDSGTSFLSSSNYHHTQELTIGEQLQFGIRVLDMRLRLLENPDWNDGDPPENRANFAVHHEADWCYLYLDQDSWVAPQDVGDVKGFVLQECLQFLKLHPTEFILFQVQEEYDPKPAFNLRFEDIVNRHNVSDPANPPILVTGTYPSVEQAKGKLVLVSSNGALPFGIQVDSSKLVDTASLYVENHWMDSNKDLKWEKVKDALKVAREDTPGKWVITYVSDGSGALHPREFASTLNEQVENMIRAYGTHSHCGTILTDFPTAGLVNAMLANYM